MQPPPQQALKRRHLAVRALALLVLLLLLHALLFFTRRAVRRPLRAAAAAAAAASAAPELTRVLSLPLSGVSSYYWETRFRGYSAPGDDDDGSGSAVAGADDGGGSAVAGADGGGGSAVAGADDGGGGSAAAAPVAVFEPLVFLFEAVYICASARVVLIGRAEMSYGMDSATFEAVRGTVLDSEGAALAEDLAFAWDARVGYESVALGRSSVLALAPGGVGVCGSGSGSSSGSGSGSGGGGSSRPPPAHHHLSLRLHFGPSRRWQATEPLHIQLAPVALGAWRARARARPATPEGARLLPAPAATPYALCTTVISPSDLVRLWVRYHALKGVGAFYLYAVAPTPPLAAALVRALRALLAGMHGGAAVTLVPWPFPMYSELGDANYAQPAALNSCASRHAAAHQGGLLFYDVDEFLVTRDKRTVGEWLAGLQARHGAGVPSYVTSMAWAVVGATPSDFNFSLPAFRALRAAPRPPPLLRSPANCTDGGDLFLCPLNCSHWAARGAGPSRRALGAGQQQHLQQQRPRYAPIPPPALHDDDERGAWSLNDTAAEAWCWHEWAGAPLPSPLPSPPPGLANAPARPRYHQPARALPTPLGLPPSRLSIDALVRAPITRTRVKVGGGREKYVVPGAGGALAGGREGGAAPLAVNIHGLYSQARAQVALQPEDGYHLHFLNSEGAEAQALRVAAFLYHFWTRQKYNSSRSVVPPEPRDQVEELLLEVDFGEALASAVRGAA